MFCFKYSIKTLWFINYLDVSKTFAAKVSNYFFNSFSMTQMSTDSTQQQTDSMHESNAGETEKETTALFLTQIENRKPFSNIENIIIRETSTFWLLDIPATCISNEDTNLGFQKERNEKYLEVHDMHICNCYGYQ